MNLTKYQELSGITVSAADAAFVTAQINRTRSILETLLGFTLQASKTSNNYYEELGKTTLECFCPDVDTENLEDPDEVAGAYRLYPYNSLDSYLWVDPFVKINAVKLVFVRQGDEPNGITMKTFDAENVRLQIGRDGWGKYIERCKTCACECDCMDCVQLAVDADWMFEDCLPSDLNYVWVDMITYYKDCKKDIKSESITTHSYTKFDREIPETLSHNLDVIRRYAGPHGTAISMPV